MTFECNQEHNSFIKLTAENLDQIKALMPKSYV